jgi:hypothetical protein
MDAQIVIKPEIVEAIRSHPQVSASGNPNQQGWEKCYCPMNHSRDKAGMHAGFNGGMIKCFSHGLLTTKELCDMLGINTDGGLTEGAYQKRTQARFGFAKAPEPKPLAPIWDYDWVGNLLNDPEAQHARDWLAARGLGKLAILGGRLGYTGTSPLLEAKHHHLLAIPHIHAGTVKAVKIRTLPPREKFYWGLGVDCNDYTLPYNWIPNYVGRVFIVETELDALKFDYLTGGRLGRAIAIPAGQFTLQKAGLLAGCELHVIPDADDAGMGMMNVIQAYFGGAMFYPVKEGAKDLGDGIPDWLLPHVVVGGVE